ncbi:MAG TPA: hypothetical protein PLP42_12870 [Acidobacteriota bacterium]|nr:hypothetical protein [Acidobacteriota bacterium]
MKILALDLGTKCGWAIDHTHRHGVWDLSVRHGESPGIRYIRFEKLLREVMTTGVDLVVYELVHRHEGTQAAHIYGGLLASLQRICDQNQVEYQGFGVAEIKKHATGKGNANKEMMIEAARKSYPSATIEDDNVADALHLLSLARIRCS